jgi:hypothetical protein
VVARIVKIILKVFTVIKMGKETSKNFTELAVNPFPTVAKEPLRGWKPISEDHFIMNEEVYQSKWLIVVPASMIKSISMVKKYDVIKGESANVFGIKNSYVRRFREALMFNDRYEHAGDDHCLPHRPSYTGLNIHSCATSDIVISIENIKVNLNRMFVKNNLSDQGEYGYSYKKLYISSWCWKFICMYFKVNNHLETVEIERDRKKGCIHYHGTLEALRQTDTLEGLHFGTDVTFESFCSLVGKFARAGVQTAPPAPPTYKEGKTSINLDHTWIYIFREENNANDVGSAKDPMLKRHCFVDLC